MQHERVVPADELVKISYDRTKAWQCVKLQDWSLAHDKIGYKTVDELIEAVWASEFDYKPKRTSRTYRRTRIWRSTAWGCGGNPPLFQIRYKSKILSHAGLANVMSAFGYSQGRLVDSASVLKDYLGHESHWLDGPLVSKDEAKKIGEARRAKERTAREVQRTYEDLRSGRRKVARVIEKAVVHYLADCIKAKEEPEPADETYLSYAGPVHVQRSRPRVPFKTSDLLNAATFVHDNSFVVLTKKEYEDMVKAISEASP
jgi:hypothetical protein